MTFGKFLFPLLTLSDPDDRHGKDAQCGGSHKQTRPGEGTGGPAEGTHSVWEGSRRVPGDEEARLPSVLLRVFSGPSWHPVQRKPAPAGGKVRLAYIPWNSQDFLWLVILLIDGLKHKSCKSHVTNSQGAAKEEFCKLEVFQL